MFLFSGPRTFFLLTLTVMAASSSSRDSCSPPPVHVLSVARSYVSSPDFDASHKLTWITVNNKFLLPGGHSEVHTVKFDGDPQVFVMKRAKDDTFQPELDTELTVLSLLPPHRHLQEVNWPCIARLRTPHPVLVSRYYARGNIIQCFQTIPVAKRQRQVHKWMLQVAMGINHIHQKHFIHRDIKPQNIMVDENLDVKVIDLGCATVDDGKPHSGQMVTIGYRSIDILRGNKRYNGSIDMYAWAIIYIELLTQERPFDKFERLFDEFDQDTPIDTMMETYEMTLYTKHPQKGSTLVARLLAKHAVPSELCELLFQCLHPEQTQRPKTQVVVDTLIQWDLGGCFPKTTTSTKESATEPAQKRRRILRRHAEKSAADPTK